MSIILVLHILLTTQTQPKDYEKKLFVFRKKEQLSKIIKRIEQLKEKWGFTD